MNEYDQFMKRGLRCKAFGRYVDDSFVVGRHKGELRSLAKTAAVFLKQRLKLDIHPDKTIICHADHGVGFLGIYLKPHRRYIYRKTLHRISNGIKRVIIYEKPANICNSLNSYLGILSHYYSYHLRYNIMRLYPELFRYGYFGKSLLRYRLRHSIKSDH